VDPVMLEELQFEIARLSRRMLIQTNYDAIMACYDRIIPNLAMVASQKFGVHPKVTQSNARTLQDAKYKVRTDLGVAETSYSHNEDDPLFGIGQGAGNASMGWLFLSSVLLDCYETTATPASYTNPDHSNRFEISMIGFVDDNNGQVNKFNDLQSLATLLWLVDKAKANATTWAGLLGVTGGALELSNAHMIIKSTGNSPSKAPRSSRTSPRKFQALK
jgi:hypothetical protein